MCSDAADRWRQHAQTSGSTSHGFRVYKYVLVGKHADEGDKSFILKSHLKLIVLESWPFFVSWCFPSVFLSLIFQCHASRKSWTLPFATTCGIWGSTFFGNPSHFEGLFYFLIQGINELSKTEHMAFPFQRGTRYPVPKTSIISTVPLLQNRPKPERKKGKHRLRTTIGFRGYISSIPTIAMPEYPGADFFGWKMSNCKCVFSNNLVKLERPHPKGRFSVAISGNSRLVNYHILAGLMRPTAAAVSVV